MSESASTDPSSNAVTRKIRWHNSLQCHFSLGLSIILVTVIIATFLVVHFLARGSLVKQNEQMSRVTGELIVDTISTKVAIAETLTKTLAKLGETLPKDVAIFTRVIAHTLDLPGSEDIIAGGGIWPAPFEFHPDIERRSFFWGRDSNNQLQYFPQYNEADTQGYHFEEWYVPGLYVPQGECLWSKSYTDPYSLAPMVTCTVPMYQKEQSVGNATVDINLGGLTELFKQATQSFGGYAFAVDRNNKFLSYPLTEHTKLYSTDAKGNRQEEFITTAALARKFTSFESTAKALQEVNQLIIGTDTSQKRRMLAERLAIESYQITRGEAPMIAAAIERLQDSQSSTPMTVPSFTSEDDLVLHEPVLISIFLMPKTLWKVVVVIPSQRIFATADDIAEKVLISLLAITLLGGVLCFVLINTRLVRPLDNLVSQLQQASQSPHSAERLDEGSNDELGLLAHQFNQRTLALEQNNQVMTEAINERQLAQDALAKSQQQLKAIASSAPDAIITINSESRIIDWNPAATMIFQEDFAQKNGKLLFSLLTAEGISLIAPVIQRYISGEDELNQQIFVVRAQRHNGSEFPLEMSLASWQEQGESFITCFMRDVTPLRKTADELANISLNDSLTAIANRPLFTDRLKQAAAITKRNNSKFAVHIIDIDDFKSVNDSLGYTMGDNILFELAGRITALQREEDTIARLGGNEFGLIQLNLTNPDQAALLAQRLINDLQSPLVINDQTIYVSVSIGIAIFPDDSDDVSVLPYHASSAKSKGKTEHPGHFQFFTAD